ncbi:class I SAM-dependent methyltransferase [Saccharomonospora sp. NPDC046836]|uniref:class I SAM-dependent DNA methyltransferase n=1 Tax=Saccharomonospora sp. NPDC046836 TaxID=3156921 RepID=UPI0033C731F2
MAYSHAHAELYDAVFLSRGKDWAAEAEQITAMIRARRPGARTLLDVGCGTGAHLAAFATMFDHVEGVEPAEAMREIARERLAGTAVHPGDMREVRLPRTFDAVTCLGFAVAYMPDSAALDTAIARMAAHLEPGGVLVVEPWWTPETFLDGYVGGHLVRENGRVVSRVTHSIRRGGATHMRIHFVVADAGGIRQFHEDEVNTLFTTEQYRAAFDRAGCEVEAVPGAAQLPGYLVGVRRP